jgi:hypothetical protein
VTIATERSSDCTGFCTDFLHSSIFGSLQFCQAHKQLLDDILPWMYVAHRGLNVIVSSNVLQRKRVSVLSVLCQKRGRGACRPASG